MYAALFSAALEHSYFCPARTTPREMITCAARITLLSFDDIDNALDAINWHHSCHYYEIAMTAAPQITMRDFTLLRCQEVLVIYFDRWFLYLIYVADAFMSRHDIIACFAMPWGYSPLLLTPPDALYRSFLESFAAFWCDILIRHMIIIPKRYYFSFHWYILFRPALINCKLFDAWCA